MRKTIFVIAVICLSLVIPTFIISCTRDEDREDTAVDVETDNKDSTVDKERGESLKDQAEIDKDSVEGDPAKGKEIFVQNCTPCHGQDGTGGGPTAAALDPKPRDLTDPSYISSLNNEHLFKVISGGGLAVGKSAAMPAWLTSLSEDQIQDVISYIRIDLCNCEFEGGN